MSNKSNIDGISTMNKGINKLYNYYFSSRMTLGISFLTIYLQLSLFFC